MITDAIISALAALLSWVGGLFPTITLPAGLTEGLATFGTYAAKYWELGHILPVGAMAAGFGLVVLASAVALAIKVIRIVASFLTAGGGSAA
jgi:hypothetical protein